MQIVKDGSTFNTTTTIKDSTGKSVRIPGGFKVTNDSANNVSDGVVIEDVNGNQFVWIPLNSANDIVNNMPNGNYDRQEGLPDSSWTVDKLLACGGFYISRFEIGKIGNRYVSKKGIQPDATISQDSAITGYKNNFINTTYAKTALINGVAWDSVMAFINGKKTGTGQVLNVNTRIPDYNYTLDLKR